MSSSSATQQPALTRDQSSTLVGQTLGLVAATTGSFALGAYVARDFPPMWGWVLFVAAIVCLFALQAAVKRSEAAAVVILLGFGALLGAAVAPVIGYYAGADPQALWLSAVATGLVVAAFGAAGYATRRDLAVLARVLFWALVALIVFGVVLVFVQIPEGALIYSILGLVVFSGLISVDFQRLRRNEDIRTAPLLAASIFLDILNVFLLFLNLFRGGDD